MKPAFKEWALVCEALGCGRQSIILRKGGIAEGRAGFSFRHSEFLLFPTWFHEQLAKTTLPTDCPVPACPENELILTYGATLEWTAILRDWSVVARLQEHHIWREEVLAERFAYEEEPGLHLAFLRIYRLDPPMIMPMEKRYGGCRSWVDLPVDECAWVSVLSDEEHLRRAELLRSLIS